MRDWSKALAVSVAGLVMLEVAGCGVDTRFVYRAGDPERRVAVIPADVVVLPFQDDTEDFTVRGSLSCPGGYVNIAKAGFDYRLDALPPLYWGKFLADDLAASGRFRSVRYGLDYSDIRGGEIVIEGAVLKAWLPESGLDPSRMAIRLEARSGREEKAIWRKEISREVAYGSGFFRPGHPFDRQFVADRFKEHFNRLLREMFLEARRDLAAVLAGGGRGVEGTAGAGEPVPADDVVRGILEGR